MKKFLYFVSFLLVFSLSGATSLMAQALTLGTVSMSGDVRVTGPGGMVYTGAGEKAPLFPGSAVKVGEGQASVDLAGKGTISVVKNSSLAFKGETPYFESGTFQVKILPGKSLALRTPQGLVEVKAGEEPAVFSMVVKDGSTKLSLLEGGADLRAESPAMVYKLEGGKYVLQGSEYSFAGKGEVFMASRGALPGGVVGAGAGGAAFAKAGSTVVLPIALGLSGVSAATMLVGANNTHDHHHHGPKVASPHTP